MEKINRRRLLVLTTRSAAKFEKVPSTNSLAPKSLCKEEFEKDSKPDSRAIVDLLV